MISDFTPMASRLAEIEARGLAYLDRRSRAGAVQHALSLSLPILPVVPVLGLAAGCFVPVRVEAVVTSALALSALGFAAAYAIARHGHREDDRAGLALHDRRLGLKDRLRTADEFLTRGMMEGFHGAAIAEAEPWVAQAQAAHLPVEHARGGMARGKLAWVAVAALLVAATSLQQHVRRPAVNSATGRVIVRAAVIVPGLGSVMGDESGGMHDGAAGTGRSALAARKASSSGRDGAGSLETGADKGANPLGAGRAGDRADANGAATGSGPSRGSGEALRDAPGNREASGASRSAQSSESGRQADVRSSGEGGGRSDGAATRPATGPSPNPGTGGGQAPSGAMPQGQPPQPSQSGSGQGKQKQNRSQQNSQSQSQESGQGKGNGTQGRRDGQDAMKSARGALSLMLAVPMRDRLGGIANPGPVSSVTRRGAPHAGAAGPVQAEGRGQLDGDAGRLEHRPMTPQERRLVRDYFRPGENGS